MPLLSSSGPSSNIAWRGTLDEYPNEFAFTNLNDVSPGETYDTGLVQITGINYKVLVSTTNNALISVNSGPFLPSPAIIRSGDRITIQITTTNGSPEDYGKTYNTTVTVGKRSNEWRVKTTDIDATPDPFFFTPILNNEISTNVVSNTVSVTGITTLIGIPVTILSPNGRLRVNGGAFVRSSTLINNDTLQLDDTTSQFYNTRITSTVRVGTYTTDWFHTTRLANVVVNPFTFNSVTNAPLSTVFTSNTITLSGADENVNGNNILTASITAGEFRVIRNGIVVRDWSPENASTQNGDQIAVRLTSSSLYSTSVSTILNVSGRSGTFTITTRPTPIDTCPNQFTFTDLIDVGRNIVVTSDSITLSGMSSATNDFGTASISGGGASFRVVRNGQTITSGTDGFQTSSIQVRQGDIITLRITSSSSSGGSTQTTFTVNGTDTSIDLNGISCSTSDTWVVRSAIRNCPINTFTLPDRTNVDPGTLQSVTFIPSGYDTDCDVTITTSDSNSYFRVGSTVGSTITNVSPGTTVELFMTAPYYDTTRTTTVTVTSSFGTTRSSTWRIIPKSPPLPEVTLDASPRSVPFIFPDGGSTTLSYTYRYVTNVNVTTNFGVSTVTIGDGSETRSVNNIPSTTIYTITVSNSTGSASASVEVIVGTPPAPTASICPSNTSSCSSVTKLPYGSSQTLFWKTTNATSITSSDFNTGNLQNGSFSTGNLTSNRTYNITATGPGGTATASHTIDLLPSVDISADNTNLITGNSTTLRWTSNLATRVVSSTGFSASSTSGSLSINPTVTTTYTITVADAENNQAQDSVTVNVSDDRTCDSFIIVNPNDANNKSSSVQYTNQSRSSVVFGLAMFRPGGSFNSSTVTGLSPGISVSASVSGEGAAFRGGSTSPRSVTNGDTIELQITNSPNFNTTRTCTLDINGVRETFRSTTQNCVVNTQTQSLLSAVITTKEGYKVFGNGTTGDPFQAYFSHTGGNENIVRTTSGGSFNQRFQTVGNTSWTVPSDVTSITVTCIGGGGGGGDAVASGRGFSGGFGGGGGGGGFAQRTFSVSPGQTVSITVGSGGGRRSSGGSTTVSVGGNSVTAGGGGGGVLNTGGSGGSPNGGNGGAPFSTANGTIAYGGSGGGSGMLSGNAGSAPRTSVSPPRAGGFVSIGGPSGNGSQLNGTATNPGTSPTDTNGGNGPIQGSGGGGGATQSLGGSGGAGGVRIDYAVNITTTTLTNLITAVVNAYRGALSGRPPTYAEIVMRYDEYRNGTMTLDRLVELIYLGAPAEQQNNENRGGMVGFKDNCGNNFF